MWLLTRNMNAGNNNLWLTYHRYYCLWETWNLVIGVQGNMFPLETYNMYTMSLLLFNSCRLNDNHLD